jgi:UDP-N-acetylglucosamine--N-acetylmuramyl-(pentapeptide) pyrophosphoryl-undecaprenol N-acetylglucosamine transferase
LATAEVLTSRGHHVTLWLAGKDTEKMVLEGWAGPVVTVPSEGFSNLRSPAALRTVWRLRRAAATCRKRMREDRPDVVLAMGSYASAGPAWAARRLRIPYVLHEANVLPGRAVRLFSRWAHDVAGCFEETRFYLRGRDIELTGMPLRRALAERAALPREPKADPKAFRLLVMGGSRGARRLNDSVTEAVCQCRNLGLAVEVVHLSGMEDEERVRAAYVEAGVPHRVEAYTGDMAEIYPVQDLAVCRSGAATCAELSAFGLPALLVPYPYATADHQTFNARAMEKCGAADVVPDGELSAGWLKDYLFTRARDGERLARMGAASRGRAVGHGAEALADVVERAAQDAKGT